MAVDPFKRASLVKAYRKIVPRNRGFIANEVFKEGGTHFANIFRVDSETGTIEMAPLTKRGGKGQLIDTGYIESGYVEFPNIRLYTPFDASDLVQIDLTQPDFLAEVDVNAILQGKIEEQLRTFRKMVEMRKEKMAADILLGGSTTYTNQKTGVSYTLDYSRSSDNSVNVGVAWSSSSAQPWKDFESVQDVAGSTPIDNALMSLQSWQEFFALDNVKADLDRKSLDIGALSPKAATMYKGMYNGVKIWVYMDKYDATNRLITAEKVCMFSSQTEFTWEYGLVQEVGGGKNNKTDVFIKTYQEENPSAIYLLCESNPAPKVSNINETFVLNT